MASIESLVSRPVSTEQLGASRSAYHDSLFRLDWTEVPTEPATQTPSQWAVLGSDELGLEGAQLYADLEALAEAVEEGAVVPETVIASCVSDTDHGDVVDSAHTVSRQALVLLQAFLADERLNASKLVLVTKGAVATSNEEDITDLAASTVWGLVRSAQSEHPDRFVLIDIDDQEESLRALPAALGTDEPQLALRQGSVSVPRLGRVGSDGVLTPPAETPAWRLDITSKGTLENLSLVACPEVIEPLRPGQIRVAVHAGGLNFRDVLIALGIYPGEADMGGEGAGVVTDVGPDVDDIAPGDHVMGLFYGGFGPITVTDHSAVVRMPSGWSFIEAASVPIVFLTAYYALMDLARLRPGEKLLVHAAAGGVGMAAVQLARHIGAEVYATASPDKWDTLRSLGLDDDHIASSRTLEFKEKFLNATDGKGVDVVLDALAREFVDASLELLPQGGRFIEMGKTDIRDSDEVASEYPGVSYRAFDLIEAGQERIQQMLIEVLELLECGVLKPLPIKTWDVRRAVEAFRFMSQARHVGKIVLTMPTVIDPEATA